MRPMNFTASELELFESLRQCVLSLPYRNVSCHELARAVGTRFKLPVADGHYLIEFGHSWLYIPGKGHVIDVCPVGHAGRSPVMIDEFVARHPVGHAWGSYRLLYDSSKKPKGLELIRQDVIVELALQMRPR